jgi:fructose-specific phosphotransferase system IIC component
MDDSKSVISASWYGLVATLISSMLAKEIYPALIGIGIQFVGGVLTAVVSAYCVFKIQRYLKRREKESNSNDV